MKQSAVEKTSIAWFKLAECIERGEKERALNLHRLLMHSHGDAAYRKKLEADLLVSFDKQKSLDYYCEAALLYAQNGDKQEVVFIYEQIVKLFPDQLEIQKKIITVCEELKWNKKAFFYLVDVVFKMMKTPSVEAITIEEYLYAALDGALSFDCQKQLDQLLRTLEVIDNQWYGKAQAYLKDLK